MGLADLHIHTSDGDGMASAPEILDSVAQAGDLSVIAITEHDDLRPALKARDLCARAGYSFEVVAGMEITTRSGHVIALYVEEPIRSFLTPDATIAAIHRAGGVALVPHPLSWLTRSVGERVMQRLVSDPETRPDAIEVGPSPAARLTASKARRLNQSAWRLAEYGGSDAHFVEAIGTAVTSFPGDSADDLRQALEASETEAVLRKPVAYCQLGIGKVLRQQWRGIWVTPRKIIGPRFSRPRGQSPAP
jgi:predicted metal-dependent phosphoesterase TrpH